MNIYWSLKKKNKIAKAKYSMKKNIRIIKEIIKETDWHLFFVSLFIIIPLIFSIVISLVAIYNIGRNNTTNGSQEIDRQIRICKTYSIDYLKNDIDFIDGKCYYKGKEVEMK